MGLSKGTLYVSVRMFTERQFGRDAVERCLAQLSRDDRDLLSSIVPVGWYPLEPILRFHRAVDKTFGRGDLALCRDVGRFSAEWQLNSFHKFLLRFKTPEWFFAKGISVWRQYHDTGRWEWAKQEPGHIVGRLFDFSVTDAAFCMREQGWFWRAAELTGGVHVVVDERRCRTRGDEFCEYEGRWQSKLSTGEFKGAAPKAGGS
ncbi:MAG TPA: hypothetical protein VKN99_11140 [Polyangia bacterium]|nr:hypothetical protein [Polyangia bacterium]